MEIGTIIALGMAFLSVATTVIGGIVFVNKLQWEQLSMKNDIDKHEKDINNLGSKLDAIQKEFRVALSEMTEQGHRMERTLVEVVTSLRHVQETCKEKSQKC